MKKFAKRLKDNGISEKDHPYTWNGIQYASDVLDGTITSNIYLYSACERFFSDILNPNNSSFYFDPELSERFLRLGQKFKHIKGRWKTPTIQFEPWQNFLFLNVFGFVSKTTGSRRFRTVHNEVARGNGKSALASIVGLFMLALDDPKGNEIYSAATGRDQARIVLDSARAMARANTSFLKNTGTEVLAHHIVHEKSNSFFKALSSDSNTLDGLQPACAIIDELHAHKNRSVFDVIDSAMSKRRDSVMFVITTAGFDTAGIGHSQSEYAKKVALGKVEDDSFFSLVYTLDEEDDIFDPKVWIKANPNLGVSVDPENLENKAKKAKENPEDRNNFKVKHLNLWVNAMCPFFTVPKWKSLGRADSKLDFKSDAFYKYPCYVGIDLSSKVDVTSFAYVVRDGNKFLTHVDNYIPEDTVRKSKNNAYQRWAETGDLIVTPGEAINYEFIQEEFYKKCQMVRVAGAHFDPWNATELSQRMLKRGVEMIEFRMNTGNLSEPMKRLEALIREGRIEHNGNEFVTWALSNVVAKRDANDNVFPRKTHEHLKIDPVVALIMGFAGWVNEREEMNPYATRGIRVI